MICPGFRSLMQAVKIVDDLVEHIHATDQLKRPGCRGVDGERRNAPWVLEPPAPASGCQRRSVRRRTDRDAIFVSRDIEIFQNIKDLILPKGFSDALDVKDGQGVG
jgi:hypothetical protein